MKSEHYTLLKPILKKYRVQNKDTNILLHKNKVSIRVGTNRIKHKIIKARIVQESHFANLSDKIYYDILIVKTSENVSITDLSKATNVLMDILLDFTIELNRYYRKES